MSDIVRTLDVRGDACPLPVIKAKKALKEMAGGSLEIITDSQTTVENLSRMAANAGYGFSSVGCLEGFQVIIDSGEVKLPSPSKLEEAPAPIKPASEERVTLTSSRTVAVIPSKLMGEGDSKLGAALMKAFVYALTQLDNPPCQVILYNGGAYLSCEGSDSLADLRALEAAGSQILTCGTCLNHYGLTEKLAVGSITNMYSIVEALAAAGTIIRP